MDQNDFIPKVRALFYALRRGQLEKVLLFLAFAFPAAVTFLRQQEWIPFHQTASYVAFAVSAVSLLWLIYRIWKRAAPPPELPDRPVPSAIKGLFPFTAADGKLFAQLGRQMELQQLIGLARNDAIPISAVRGESGAGKTSLLQAGLAYTLGEQQCIYWEAVPENATAALLHTIRSRIPEIVSLESLPQACPRRCILILDQFEQLRREDSGHAPVFALLVRIAKVPAPYNLSAIAGFRREYTPDWLDFEQECDFRAEQLPVNLLARTTAADALVNLANEAGFTLDHALVENFITSVARAQGILPIDIAIGVLSLANFVQQHGVTHIGLKEYNLAGGAQGLLLSFVQRKLEEIPEELRAPLLKGIVLGLVGVSDAQRVAAGETAAVIASKVEVSERSLTPWLERLAHPRVRLLEKLKKKGEPVRYRLPHERLVPVLHRLAGGTLASLDQLRLLFEGEFERWRETGNRRHLLGGKDLRSALRNREQLVQGETAPTKTAYLAACIRRRDMLLMASGFAVVAAAGSIYEGYRAWNASIQRQMLASWGLPLEISKIQSAVDRMDLTFYSINDLTWLESSRIKEIDLKFNGSSLEGLERLQGLTSLTLDLGSSQIENLAELEKIQGLTSLSLRLGNSRIPNLNGLRRLKGLKSLSLDLDLSYVTSLAGLEDIRSLVSLSLGLRNSHITSLINLEKLTQLTSLSVELDNSRITTLGGWEKLQKLTSLSLGLGDSQVKSLIGLDQFKELTSLSVVLHRGQVVNLSGLDKLTSLLLNLGFSGANSLVGLDQLQGLTSLALVLGGSQVGSLVGLEKLQGLTSLSLDLGYSLISSLAPLEQLKELSSLSLDFSGNQARIIRMQGPDSPDPWRVQIKSLKGLEKLQGLTSLSLNLGRSDITSLDELIQLKTLTSLELNLDSSEITNLTCLEHLQQLKSLTLFMNNSRIKNLDALERLHQLKSLKLGIEGSDVTSLDVIGRLQGLTSIKIVLPASLLPSFARTQIQRDIVQLWIVIINGRAPLKVPVGYKFIGIGDFPPPWNDHFWEQ